MGKKQLDDTPILQNLIDGFISLKNCLSNIGPILIKICRTQDEYGIKIIFSKTDGTIETVKWLLPRTNDEKNFRIANIDKSHELLENCQTEIIEEGNILPELVETIHKTVQQLHQALNDLPDNVHNYLSKAHRRSWHLLVRQECLDLICYWPKHPSDPQRGYRIYTPDRLRVPNRVDELLEYTTKVDPTPFWQKLSQKLDSYIDDVYAIRGEFNAEGSSEQDTRSDPPKWYSEDESQKPAEYTFGPLTGTLKDLSRWMGEINAQGRKVKQMQKQGHVWICMHHKRSYSVWFRDERVYATANRGKIVEERESITTKQG